MKSESLHKVGASILHLRQNDALSLAVQKQNFKFIIRCNSYHTIHTKIFHPIKINTIPVGVRAKRIKDNKYIVSIETSNSFSYSDNLKGSYTIRYGKESNFFLSLLIPYFESHVTLNSSKLVIDHGFGFTRLSLFEHHKKLLSMMHHLSSLFITWTSTYDYNISMNGNRKIGILISTLHNKSTTSFSYDFIQQLLEFRNESHIHPQIITAASFAFHKKFIDSPKDITFTSCNVGTIIKLSKYNSEIHLKFNYPNYEIVGKYHYKFNNNICANITASNNFTNHFRGVGIRFLI